MSCRFIFVYGTLRKEISSSMYHVLTSHSEYYGDGFIQAKLYEIDEYPGAIETENQESKVKGELYKIINEAQLLSKLDEYEESSNNFPQPHEYVRKKLPVSLINGGKVMAWVYFFNHDTSNFTQIMSGDYLSYFKGESVNS